MCLEWAPKVIFPGKGPKLAIPGFGSLFPFDLPMCEFSRLIKRSERLARSIFSTVGHAVFKKRHVSVLPHYDVQHTFSQKSHVDSVHDSHFTAKYNQQSTEIRWLDLHVGHTLVQQERKTYVDQKRGSWHGSAFSAQNTLNKNTHKSYGSNVRISFTRGPGTGCR